MKKIFIPCFSNTDPLPPLSENLAAIKYDRVGVVSTTQHLNQLEKIKAFLEENRKTVFIGGQILGCSQKNALSIEKKVDCFLYVGSGMFHPIGLAVNTQKPVFILNPYSKTLSQLAEEEKQRWARKRKGSISRALTAETFGILVSTKVGQFNMNSALKAKKKIERLGRKAIIFAGSELNPSNVLGFKVDAWVNTACPRIADDFFEKPVINFEEIQYLTNERTKTK